jgi:type VI secretion system secreted protein Hcp
MKSRFLIGFGVLVLAAAGATLAWATTGSDSNTIDACVAKNGKVSIYPPGQSCLASERKVSWNIQGPPGAQGPPGPAGSADPRALDGTITITGQHSGDFGPGLKITGFSHEVVSPRDPATGLATGRRQHKPFTITKELDASSPLLLNSLYTNETLTSVLIGLLRPSGQTMATVKLTNAQVSDDVQNGNTETISFTYQKIDWTWTDSGVTASDDWEAPNS